MVNDELKQKGGYGFVRKICGEVIKDHVLDNLDIIVRPKMKDAHVKIEYHQEEMVCI